MLHMKIILWNSKKELQKARPSPEHLHVLIRILEPSRASSSIEYVPGSGAAETDICNTRQQL